MHIQEAAQMRQGARTGGVNKQVSVSKWTLFTFPTAGSCPIHNALKVKEGSIR